MIRRITAIDAHAAGQPLRLITGGFPLPRGATMQAKRDWLKKRWDRLRRAVLREPRGHAGLCGALLTEPLSPGAHAGLLFLDAAGYPPLSGHGVIAALTVALERRLLQLADPQADIVLDTPAGVVRARASMRADGRVERVSYEGVPAFVLRPGLPVALGARVVPVDVAFGGAFYAIVDGEAAGAAVRRGRLEPLRALAAALVAGVEAAIDVVHPVDPGMRGISGTLFTGAPERADAHLRSATVFGGGRLGRSPGGTGTAALLAVLDAMGLLAGAGRLVHEGIAGTTFTAAVAGRAVVGGLPTVWPRVEGDAWITGEQELVIDDADPLRDGYVL